jgi:hypothetical protein
LEQLEAKNGCEINDQASMLALGFADLILLKSNHNAARRLVTHNRNYLNKLGMDTTADRYPLCQTVITDVSWSMDDPQLKLIRSDNNPSSAAYDTVNLPWMTSLCSLVCHLQILLTSCVLHYAEFVKPC